jgi:hypothetical protein
VPQELCNKIMAGTYTAPEWLSAPMKDLLARMLTVDPDKRITFQQASGAASAGRLLGAQQPCATTQHNTQHTTTQHNTTQHNTTLGAQQPCATALRSGGRGAGGGGA